MTQPAAINGALFMFAKCTECGLHQQAPSTGGFQPHINQITGDVCTWSGQIPKPKQAPISHDKRKK